MKRVTACAFACAIAAARAAAAEPPIEAACDVSVELPSTSLELSDDSGNISSDDKVILIVENDAGFARFLLDMAHENNFKGLITARGAAAIAMAREVKPHAVTLDINLPDIDGWRVLNRLKDEGKTVFFSTHILSDAEALCDRVAVIRQGELRGVGAVPELTSQTQGRIEIIFYASRVPAALTQLGADARVSGNMVNAVLPEKHQDAALEVLRREHLKLISLTPVRRSLEEYYIQNTRPIAGPKEEGPKEENRKGVSV